MYTRSTGSCKTKSPHVIRGGGELIEKDNSSIPGGCTFKVNCELTIIRHESSNMSRQQDPKGVILTGYISNIEVVSPASGVNSAEEIESSSLR